MERKKVEIEIYVIHTVQLVGRGGRTHSMNMLTPVFSISLATPFQLAIIVNFCLAFKGSRGSVAAGGGGLSWPDWFCDTEDASLPSLQPILKAFEVTSGWKWSNYSTPRGSASIPYAANHSGSIHVSLCI